MMVMFKTLFRLIDTEQARRLVLGVAASITTTIVVGDVISLLVTQKGLADLLAAEKELTNFLHLSAWGLVVILAVIGLTWTHGNITRHQSNRGR
jgi:hypothetical protein